MVSEKLDARKISEYDSVERGVLINLADIVLFEEESPRKAEDRRRLAYQFQDAVRAFYTKGNKLCAIIETAQCLQKIVLGEVALVHQERTRFPVIFSRLYQKEE